MKILKQLGIILTILWIGKSLGTLLNLPIPGTILGMILLLMLLMLKVIKLPQVSDITSILLSSLPLLFIPAAVGLINEFASLKGNIIKLGIILVITQIIVIVVTGKVIQFFIVNFKGRRTS